MAMPKFNPVKSLRVSEYIAAQLKKAILGGDFKPNQKLPSERELTETFQASRVVVREAIRALELNGFVSMRQGPLGGAYVQRLGYDRLTESYADLFMAGELSVHELMQARIHIEPEVTRLATGNIDTAWAAQLQEALAGEQIPAKSHADWVRRNMATDDILIKMCGNRLYQAILEPLIKLTQEIVLVVKPERTIIHDPRDHHKIVAAVLKGDGPAAAEAMRTHIQSVGEKLIGLEELYRLRKGLAQK
jgi:GntR family transcriptional regulator, transcriptional repressor for pyruvate dehydrogenase complex